MHLAITVYLCTNMLPNCLSKQTPNDLDKQNKTKKAIYQEHQSNLTLVCKNTANKLFNNTNMNC